jgi:hypothetical protein
MAKPDFYIISPSSLFFQNITCQRVAIYCGLISCTTGEARPATTTLSKPSLKEPSSMGLSPVTDPIETEGDHHSTYRQD